MNNFLYDYSIEQVIRKSVILLMMILQAVKLLLIIVPLLLTVAFLTLAERKVLAAMQLRQGPNVVGYLGLLQPIADGAKLVLKELILPTSSNKLILLGSPVVVFFLSLLAWTFIPLGPDRIVVDSELGMLYILAISSLSVYGIIMAGWSSNSRYAFLGALRSAAQMISYEVSIGLTLISILISVGSASLTEIVLFQQYIFFMIPFLPLALVFFVSVLAETNRPPFDLPEAEGELVAGYNVEFSSVGFAMFFIGEYANIILMSMVFVIFFMGGWLNPFNLHSNHYALPLIMKMNSIIYGFLWVRASFPRFRYDQLMYLGWKVLLPISLALTMLTSLLLLITDGLPT